MKLLTVENAKTVKGEELGYLTGILYLAPAMESGVMNTCAMSTPGCRASCLYTAERAEVFPAINGTSDLPQLALEMAREFPAVQFYDYTKIPRPWTRVLPNYHLTFSLSESNY